MCEKGYVLNSLFGFYAHNIAAIESDLLKKETVLIFALSVLYQ